MRHQQCDRSLQIRADHDLGIGGIVRWQRTGHANVGHPIANLIDGAAAGGGDLPGGDTPRPQNPRENTRAVHDRRLHPHLAGTTIEQHISRRQTVSEFGACVSVGRGAHAAESIGTGSRDTMRCAGGVEFIHAEQDRGCHRM